MNKVKFFVLLMVVFFFAVSICNASTIELPQTGQTTCYNTAGTEIACSNTGQDGDIQAGVVWPAKRFVSGTGIEANCIIDTLTGLMWPKNGNLAGGTKTWQDALAYSNNLNYCGHSDWRLPNVNELRSLVNTEESGTAAAWLSTQGFSGVQSYYYWSSSTIAYYTYYAWYVDMWDGLVYGYDKTDSYYVFPVRAGQSGSFGVSAVNLPRTGQTTCYDTGGNVISCAGTGQDGDVRAGVPLPNPRFVPGIGTEADCIIDTLTGLMWPKNGNFAGTKKTWQQALNYSNNLNYCGHLDWRLPNVNELRSLVNTEESGTAAWLNTQGFNNVQSSSYWSSSTHADHPYGAWGVYMWYGSVYGVNKTSSLYVFPVRAGQIRSFGDFGALSGNVQSSGGYLSGVTVTIDGVTVSTDSSGSYETGTYPPGNYTVAFSQAGYITHTIPNATIFAGQKTTLNTTMQLLNTTIIGKPALLGNSKAVFYFTSNLVSATFQCQLDTGAWISCSSSKTYTALAEGSHTFQVRAMEGTNADLTPASYTWTVDNTKPTADSISPTPITTEQGWEQIFTAAYSDEDGFANIKSVELIVNTTTATANALYLSYDMPTNKLTLYDNAGTTPVGTCTPKTTGTLSNAQGSLNCLKTTVTKSGNTITVKWAITPAAVFSVTSAKKLYMKATDKAGNATAFIQKGTWTIIGANQPPTLGTLTPTALSSKAGVIQSFTATYADQSGNSNIKTTEIQIGTTGNGSASIWARYDRSTNKLYLLNDAGTGYVAGGGCTPALPGSISNAQGTLHCDQTLITKMGNSITVKWSIAPVFTGTKDVKMKVTDYSNLTTGFVKKGTWTINP